MHYIQAEKRDTRERINLLSLKDLEMSHYCGSGKGGQAKNKVASGVMFRHEESGAIGRASDSRSEHENKVNAFRRLVADPRMKFWLAKKVHEIRLGETLEENVRRDMADSNLRFEVKNESGQWIEKTPEYFETEQAKTIV